MMASNRQTAMRPTRRVVRQRTPLSGEMGGTQDTTEYYEVDKSNGRRDLRKYSPVKAADTASSGIGLLEAEYFAILFLLILELFAGSSSYGDKMISTMKRGTLVTLLFFILALIAGVGPNASKVAKGIGALVFVGILLSSPGTTLIGALDNFAKSDWIGGGDTGSNSADTGTQASSSGTIASAEGAAKSSANTITEIQIPGIGPVFAAGTIIDNLKKLFHL